MTDVLTRLTSALSDRYAVERELGRGGMATVYAARDLKHGRGVAIKVLLPELAAVLGAERFLREIQIAAQLSHPHILPLHDSGQLEGLLYYVMPYVEGESLRGRLEREKELPIGEAVRITQQVASALDYAHRHGVVHRDIKPENILLQEGQALVSDFGIALAVRAAGGERLTETGLSLGTPFYMSPEQAMGDRPLDARSDIYSLGCVLYEMLAGSPPYTGPTAQAVIAKLLTEHAPSVTVLRETVPPALAQVVSRAIARLPADRHASAAEFSDALARTSPEPGPVAVATPAVPIAAAARAPAAIWGALLARGGRLAPWLVAAAATGAAIWSWMKPRPAERLMRFGVVLPDSQSLRTDHNGVSIALSPDGERLAYVGRSQQGRRMLLVRELDQLAPRELRGTEDAESPFFSPDGEWVAFFAQSKLKKVALAGGPPLAIADAPGGRGGSWGPGGVIVFAPSSVGPLLLVSEAGGPTDTLTAVRADTGETSHRFPEFLPDGRDVVFTIQYGARYGLAAVSLADRAIRLLIDQAFSPRYVASGHLLYAGETGALLAVPFDPRRREVTGSPMSLLEGMLVKVPSGAAEYSLAANGTMAYLTGSAARRALLLVDRQGRERALTELIALASPRFSPDGRRIALTSVEQRGTDVRVLDLDRGTLARLTFDGNSQYPDWTPDGRRIVFTTNRPRTQANDLYWVPADGSGEATPLVEAPYNQWEIAWAPNGRSAIVRQSTPVTQRDLLMMSIDSPGVLRPYLATQFEERTPAISPDGRWVAYASDASGRDEVYVRAYPQSTGLWQVSVAGGTQPRWAASGREIFYRSGDSLVSVDVATSPTFSVGSRRVVLTRPYTSDPNRAQYDVHPDGQRFVVIRAGLERSNVILTFNWFEELRRRSGTVGRRE